MDTEQALDLGRYLHQNIPLSAAMQVSVVEVSAGSVTLAAPLAPNINHKSTVFGGSASAVAILAAWSLLHLRLTEAGLFSEIVIQSSQMQFDRPIAGDFTATSFLPDVSAWPAFMAMLERRKRARIEVHATLNGAGTDTGRFSGRFVAFLRDARQA